MNPSVRSGIFVAILAAWLSGCGRDAHSEVAASSAAGAAGAAKGDPSRAGQGARAPSQVPQEAALGLADRGLWSDLDPQIQLPAPVGKPAQISASLDAEHRVLVVEVDGWPVKAYPLGTSPGAAEWKLGGHTLQLRPGDRAELAPLLTGERLRELPALPPASAAGRRRAALEQRGDRDDDGIPDALDVLIGARKTVLNADAYTGGYVSLRYPMGDVPRTIGVCTDVIVRAMRNAGVDLQRDLHEDIARAPRSYPMVKGKGDPNIDHRRVKTLLPLFLRKWQRHTTAFDDPADPLRPGDVVLMDTFPSRTGPDHIGIVSDRLGPSGLPLIINNWTDGTVTAEMDLLTFVPVTHRFRR